MAKHPDERNSHQAWLPKFRYTAYPSHDYLFWRDLLWFFNPCRRKADLFWRSICSATFGRNTCKSRTKDFRFRTNRLIPTQIEWKNSQDYSAKHYSYGSVYRLWRDMHYVLFYKILCFSHTTHGEYHPRYRQGKPHTHGGHPLPRRNWAAVFKFQPNDQGAQGVLWRERKNYGAVTGKC